MLQLKLTLAFFWRMFPTVPVLIDINQLFLPGLECPTVILARAALASGKKTTKNYKSFFLLLNFS